MHEQVAAKVRGSQIRGIGGRVATERPFIFSSNRVSKPGSFPTNGRRTGLKICPVIPTDRYGMEDLDSFWADIDINQVPEDERPTRTREDLSRPKGVANEDSGSDMQLISESDSNDIEENSAKICQEMAILNHCFEGDSHRLNAVSSKEDEAVVQVDEVNISGEATPLHSAAIELAKVPKEFPLTLPTRNSHKGIASDIQSKNRSGGTLRRSARRRMRPLHFWRNERVEYQRRVETHLPEIVNLILLSPEKTPWRPRHKQRIQKDPSKRQKAKKIRKSHFTRTCANTQDAVDGGNDHLQFKDVEMKGSQNAQSNAGTESRLVLDAFSREEEDGQASGVGRETGRSKLNFPKAPQILNDLQKNAVLPDSETLSSCGHCVVSLECLCTEKQSSPTKKPKLKANCEFDNFDDPGDIQGANIHLHGATALSRSSDIEQEDDDETPNSRNKIVCTKFTNTLEGVKDMDLMMKGNRDLEAASCISPSSGSKNSRFHARAPSEFFNFCSAQRGRYRLQFPDLHIVDLQRHLERIWQELGAMERATYV